MNSGQFRSCSLPSSDSKYGGCTKIFEDDDVGALLPQFQYNLLYNDSLHCIFTNIRYNLSSSVRSLKRSEA